MESVDNKSFNRKKEERTILGKSLKVFSTCDVTFSEIRKLVGVGVGHDLSLRYRFRGGEEVFL